MPLSEVSGNPQEGELRAMPLMERLAHAHRVAMLEDKESIEAAADRIAELEAASRRLLDAMKAGVENGETFPAAVAFAGNNLENILSR